MFRPEVEFNQSKEVDGVTGWWWIKTDSGAWDGPKMDWETGHKPVILKYLPTPEHRMVAVQAGGNLGMYPKLLSKLFSVVYTFEPDVLNFYTLSLNCTEENIIKTNAALGAEHRMIAVNRNYAENVGMHTVNTTVNGAIPMLKLDDFVWPGPRVDLLMLDIEGFEIFALAGGEQTLRNHRPIVFLELPSPDVIAYMQFLGYEHTEMSVRDAVFFPKNISEI